MIPMRGGAAITGRAVARIAARAAGGSAEASVEDGAVLVRVAVTVPYPAPIGPAARRVRDEVRAQVQEMTGLSVRRVDVEVTGLAVGR